MTPLIYLAVPCGALDPPVWNDQPRDDASHVDNSTDVGVRLEYQWSSGR